MLISFVDFCNTSIHDFCKIKNHPAFCRMVLLVGGEGFEPSKAMLTDLQSAPFGQLGNPPSGGDIIIWLREMQGGFNEICIFSYTIQ